MSLLKNSKFTQGKDNKMTKIAKIPKIPNDTEYPILVSGASELNALKANLGSGGIEPGSLDKIKIPGSGGKAFEIPDVSGEKSEKSFKGIIVKWADIRAYWKGEFGGEQAPDCNSFDSTTGVGDPGGDCLTCPLAQWGSADKGNGQACKSKRKMLILMEGNAFPVIMDAPTMSIAPIKKYFQQLASKNVPYFTVVTVFGLEQSENASKIKFSKLSMALDRHLTADEKDGLASYSTNFESAFRGN